MPSNSQLYAALRNSAVPLEDEIITANVIIYGPPGAGKTVELVKLAQAVTAPDKEIVYLDSAQGFVSLKNHPGLMKRVIRYRFKGVSQLGTLAAAIAEKAEGFENVGAVIIDEVSSIAKEDLSLVVVARIKAEKITEYDGADWPGYNANLERVSRELRKLYKLPIHILMASHMRESEVQSGANKGKRVKRPSMPPELAEVGNGLAHVLAYMESSIKDVGGKVQYVHTLQVHSSSLVNAKSRVGGLPVKVTPDVFNQRMVEFVQSGTEVNEEKPIEVDDSFAIGIEVEE